MNASQSHTRTQKSQYVQASTMTIIVDRSGKSEQVFAKSELEEMAFQSEMLNDDFNREEWESGLMEYNMSDTDDRQSFMDYHYDLVQDNGTMRFHLSDSAIGIYQKSNS